MISIKSFTHIDQPNKLAKKAFKKAKVVMTNRGIKSENNAHQHTEDGGPIEIKHQKKQNLKEKRGL